MAYSHPIYNSAEEERTVREADHKKWREILNPKSVYWRGNLTRNRSTLTRNSA